MTNPFSYPSEPHRHRHGPCGYANYESYRPWLRDEFDFRCVYCLAREQWTSFKGAFALDHFNPVAISPDARSVYENLIYCCNACNLTKGDRAVSDPLELLVSSVVSVDGDGEIRTTSNEAASLIEQLGLDDERLVEFRKLWIGITDLAAEFNHDLFRTLMQFPADLPDLSTLRPPEGNSRPDGVETCYFNMRLHGELPATY